MDGVAWEGSHPLNQTTHTHTLYLSLSLSLSLSLTHTHTHTHTHGFHTPSLVSEWTCDRSRSLRRCSTLLPCCVMIQTTKKKKRKRKNPLQQRKLGTWHWGCD